MVVVGTSCSGKTTFARRLADLLGCRHIELDALHWAPNWVERPDEEFRASVAEAVSSERWVVDGNYRVVRDLTWPRATHVVWLDFSFPIVFSRALARTIRRSVTGEELFAGNRETLRQSFLSRESILYWVLSTYGRRRGLYGGLMRENPWPALEWIHFRRPADAERLLRSLSISSHHSKRPSSHHRCKGFGSAWRDRGAP